MRHRYLSAWLVVVLVLGLAAATVLAQEDNSKPSAPSAGYTVEWATLDGGGGSSLGGGYTLSGTAGQADAGPGAAMSGGTYTLVGGFWTLPISSDQREYLPMILQ